MKEYLPYVERELGTLEGFLREFSERYSALARRLGMSDGACEDPHIERWIQATALLNARTAKRLDDNYPEFTEAMLNVNYPHYLQPFPSCSIARVDYAGAHAAKISTVTTIPRGTAMNAIEHNGVICKFRTAYDVTVAPVVLSQVTFDAVIGPAVPRPLPVGVKSMISIVIEGTSATLGLAQMGLKSLRVFIDGEQSFCATLRDTLFMGTPCAYVEAGGRWRALDKVPVAPVGFAEQDALIPFKATSHPAYRLLTEYFAFPEKFNFFDIDLAALTRDMPAGCQRVTLHLALAGLRADSDTARILATLSNKNLLLACTPVVNLFPQSAAPITLNHTKAEYELAANAKHMYAYDIYSVDNVHIVRDSPTGGSVTEFRPYYSLRHGDAGGSKGHYYVTRRDEIMAVTNPGHDTYISFVDIDLDPLATETATVSIDMTCTNRDLPGMLDVGLPGGDLVQESAVSAYPIRFLRKPTSPHRFDPGAHWRLISQLSLNHHSLVQDGVEAFTEMLTLYDLPQSKVSQRQIRGIVGLSHESATAWLRDDKHGGAKVHGIEVRMTVDEDAFVGSGLHLFAQVIDHFLGLYVHLNSFTRLVILSKNNAEELIRCQARNGDLNLV